MSLTRLSDSKVGWLCKIAYLVTFFSTMPGYGIIEQLLLDHRFTVAQHVDRGITHYQGGAGFTAVTILIWGITYGCFVTARLQRHRLFRATIVLVLTLLAFKAFDLLHSEFRGTAYAADYAKGLISGKQFQTGNVAALITSVQVLFFISPRSGCTDTLD